MYKISEVYGLPSMYVDTVQKVRVLITFLTSHARVQSHLIRMCINSEATPIYNTMVRERKKLPFAFLTTAKIGKQTIYLIILDVISMVMI